MPVAFDTHQLITRLIQGQMSVVQAEAISAALQEALENSIGQLATKTDLADVRKDLQTDIAAVRTDIKHLITRLTWMVGVYGGITMLILGKLLLFK